MSRSLALAIVLLGAVVDAREVAKDGQGGTLDVSGFYKNFLSGVLLQPGVVEVANATTGLVVPEAGITDAHLARLATKFRFEDTLELEVAWQLTFLVASDPVFTSGAALTSTVSGTGATPHRRLFPLGGTLARSSTTRLEHDLDRLALKLSLPIGDVTLGRQVLSWGTGRFWNPTDVLSPFPPTSIDREVRRGFDAVRLAIALGDVTQLDLLYLPQPIAENNGGVVRFQTNLLEWDGSLSVGKYVRDFVIGADLVGDIGPVAVHAEAAYTLEWAAPSGLGDHFLRAALGADFMPHERVVVTVEYSFNGFGSTDPSQYAAILASPRAQRGEVFGAGMHVAALAASWRANDLLSTQLSVLCNLTDPSALVLASAEYSFAQSVLVRVGAYVPVGRGPDASGSAEELRVTRGLRSEYGSGSYGAFVQVGLYVP